MSLETVIKDTILAEAVDLDGRLQLLVRAGLMPVNTLPILRRSIAKVQSGLALQGAERDVMSTFINAMMFIVLGDDTIFNRARMSVREESETVVEGENKEMKGKDPCWKGYEMVGTKKKGGKEVPNCVPANEEVEELDEISADMAHRYLIGRHKRDYDISPDGKSAKSKKSMTYDQMVKKGNSTTRALRTIEKEKKGILNREEAEQIDELSKKTLASYINKSTQNAVARGIDYGYSKDSKDSANALKKLPNRVQGIKKATDKLTKEEAEQIDEISAKTIDRYREQSHRKEYPGPKGSKKYEKRARGSIMAFNKLTGRAKVPARMEEAEIIEARGRPRKDAQKDYTIHPKTKEKLMHNNPAHMKRIEALHRTGALQKPKVEAGQNIITQLRKASTSMRGGEKVNFNYGASTHVSAAHAQKILDKHASMRPAEKEKFQKDIGHSHAMLKKHV